jgi:hypothetical protein
LRSGLPQFYPRRDVSEVLLLVVVTTTLPWKAKSLERKLFGRSDEARLINQQAPELKLRFPA